MRFSVLLVTITSIAVVVGAFGGSSSQVRGADYTVGMHALTDKSATDPTVLTNGQGLTLYYSTADTPTRSSCTGACAKTWVPLVSTAKPTKDPKIRGTVAVVHDVHGAQVAYNGHLLYTYVGDKAPGEAKGKGLAGKWFTATPALGRW